MFKYKSAVERLIDAHKKNTQLQQENLQVRADLDFVAIMADIEIPADDDEEVLEDE